jgi:hypothetical protein
MAEDSINTQPSPKPGGSNATGNHRIDHLALESYFEEAGLPSVLKPGMSGIVCCNIRTALSSLGLWHEWRNADLYDEELQSAVRKFQFKYNHPNLNGYVGPGTRRLLVLNLIAIEFDFTKLLAIFNYDVALSFSGADHKAPEHLAEMLRRNEIRVFCDSFEQANLWGKPFIEHLKDVCNRRARFCVIFVSNVYTEKAWSTHESRLAQEMAFRDIAEEYIVLVRLDDSTIPELRSTLGYIEIQLGIDTIGRLLIDKIRQHRARTVKIWSAMHSNTFG